jgi:glycosyltransferase involved in cell wall biosynthesis
MKIFQIIQKPQLRGAEIFACQLSKKLSQKGHECVVVTLFKGDAVLPFTERIVHLGLSKKNRFIDWTGWKKLADLIKSEKPDIIQANAGDTLKYAVISKLLFRWKIPIIFRNASTVSLYIKNPWVKWWNSLLYSVTDYVISVSEYTREDLVSVFPFVSGRISVIPIGIEMERTIVKKKPEGDVQVLLHIGGFTFEKNHMGLVRIIEQVIMHNPKAFLWLIGDGPLRVDVEQFVKARSLTNNVKFFGYQSDPLQFFQYASVLLLPSIIEGLPAVILEAFYSRVAVVAYNVGGISELVKTGETGFLIEKEAEDKFAQAILEVLRDGNEIAEYTEKAYRIVSQNYALDTIVTQFIDVYTFVKNDQS